MFIHSIRWRFQIWYGFILVAVLAGFGPPQPPKNFHLPPQAASLFDETDTNGFYYVFTWRDDHVVARSANAPRIVMGAGYDDQFNRINAPSALPASTPGAK